MPSLTVENYIKAIYQISVQQDKKPVTTGQLATALGVAPGTVTSMLKTLNTAGLARHTPYEGVSLSRTGQVLALRMIRRHRLIEQFLVQTLSMNWDEVHDEAEHMEHAVSDLLVDRIDEYLGRPEVDPHGDPIPRGTTASIPERMNEYHTLSTFPTGFRRRQGEGRVGRGAIDRVGGPRRPGRARGQEALEGLGAGGHARAREGEGRQGVRRGGGYLTGLH